MRDVLGIKTREREASARYIRKLYASLPKEPITVFEFELERTIWRDIEDAEKEHALI